ncbi:unnamed protein product, partial [Polarella glacialis]
AEQTKFATLSWEEFQDFLATFRVHDIKRLKAEFTLYDTDGSGGLDFEEVHVLLQKMGYSAMLSITEEAFASLGCTLEDAIRPRQFEQLREHLRVTEGFCRADLSDLRQLYNRTTSSSKAISQAASLPKAKAKAKPPR